MIDESEELKPSEAAALREWGESWTPPRDLRHRTRAALRSRDLLASGTRPKLRWRFAWVMGNAFALFLAFFAGLRLGDAPSSTPAEAPSGHLYMLLLYESASYQTPQSPAAHRERVREYGAWARELAASGRFVDGNELGDHGTWYRPSPGGPVSAPPRLDPERGRLAGYFVVEAVSEEAIVGVMESCPHLRHGGSIEIRRIGSG